jgi:hypothetical protein
MQRQDRQLLALQPIGCDLAALAKEDEIIGTIPVLDDSPKGDQGSEPA